MDPCKTPTDLAIYEAIGPYFICSEFQTENCLYASVVTPSKEMGVKGLSYAVYSSSLWTVDRKFVMSEILMYAEIACIHTCTGV